VIDTTTTTTNRSSSSRNGSFNYLIHFAHGFVPKAHHLSTKVLPNDNNKYHKDIIISFAKPPPTSKFDLEAIEALEAELDYQERLERMKNDNIKDMSQQDMVTSHDDNNNGEEDDHHNWEYMSLSNSQNAESTKSFQVSPMLHNQRLDSILSDMIPELSRSQCGSLISEGMVSILTLQDQESGREPTVITRKSLKVGQGTMIQVRQGIEEVPTEILAQNLPLDILYEDEYMIVLNKAAGMVVHPAIGNWDGTVVNALAYYLANESPFGSGEFIGQDGKVKMDVTTSSRGNTIAIDGMNDNGDGETMVFRPGIVHRLDKGTTGILVVAKTKEALTSLSEAFASRQVRKTYVAVTGKFLDKS
jgi:23S rRNA-/tRNA-specific pseudouridylate synthase